MAKDRIVIRMLFSGALILFGILHLLYTIFSRFRKQNKFKKDLQYIKESGLGDIIEESLENSELYNTQATRKEIDTLVKEIYFNLYKKHRQDDEVKEGYSDMEHSIDNILDTSILQLIEEKDKLLQEKNKIILMLEEKNEKFINETIGKISYLMQEKDQLLEEKDRLLQEKDRIIYKLQKKNPKEKFFENKKTVPVDTKPTYHHKDEFLNVNHY